MPPKKTTTTPKTSKKNNTVKSKTTTVRRRRTAAAEVIPPEVIWENLIASTKSKETIDYSTSKQYKVNDLVKHSTFGLGVVTTLSGPSKARIAFKQGELLMVCNR